MEGQNNGSGVNTILIVIVILILGFFGFRYFTQKSEAPTTEGDSVNIDLSLGEENGETLPQ
ncbi:MAG: hypothetical protein QG654_271 [Patescibacteria group bacterium]|nr:hypothetical protein [Patescibacteria group bacterium]